MATIGSFEAKTKFSALLERVERGEQRDEGRKY
jgi:antitoxin (DNA-binding transcriptional repressor) of toxin-antitoxin stability system